MVSLSTQFVIAAAWLSSLASAASPVSIPIYRPKTSRSLQDVVAKDLTRAASFGTAAASSGTAPAINEDSSYIVDVTVGTQTFSLIVDTGSSNTWVGAGTKFTQGSATDTGDSVSVDYGSGSFSGTEYIDTVTLGGLTVSQQSIGVAKTSEGFTGVDGILGFGPEDLTEDTVSGQSEVPTFMQNLVSDGLIAANILGVSFAPESGSSVDTDNGELDFGATDSSKFSGSITYTDITTTEGYDFYWGIDVSGVTFGSTSVGSSAPAIVDTGTTVIILPSTLYSELQTASKGSTDASFGVLEFTTEPTSDVTFTIGGAELTLTPSQYLIPSAQFEDWGLTSGRFYSWFANGGTEAPNFIIGQKFLENFYSVFDTENSRVGFAVSTA